MFWSAEICFRLGISLWLVILLCCGIRGGTKEKIGGLDVDRYLLWKQDSEIQSVLNRPMKIHKTMVGCRYLYI